MSAGEINEKYALNPETLRNLDKEFEKNMRNAREELAETAPAKKMTKKK